MLRGGALLIAAKVVHVLAGFGLYFLVALAFTRSRGEIAGTAAFGVWGATFGVMNPINQMAATATLQMISRAVACRSSCSAAVFRTCARLQLPLVTGVFLVLVLGARPIARIVLNDETYAPYLRLASIVPVFYAVRALYQGYLNGTRRFREQAWLDIGGSLSRMLLVVAGAALGFGAMGAIAGFVTAAAAIAVVALVWIRLDSSGPPAADGGGFRELLSFQALVVAVTLATQYLINVDVLAVKALGAADPVVADRYAGYYTAAQRLAQIPMSVVVALAYLMFPFVAAGSAERGGAREREVVRGGLRTLLLLIVPCTAVLASTTRESLPLVFPTIVRTAVDTGDSLAMLSRPLAVLTVGYLLFALFQTASILITAAGRPGLSAAIAGAALALAWFLTRALTPPFGLLGAALGVTLAWALGLAACAVVMRARFGAFVPLASAARILASGAAIYGLSLAVPVAGLSLLLKDALLMLGFVGLLLATRETSVSELRGVLHQLLGRRHPAPRPAGDDGP